MTPEQIQALVERAIECPCACETVDVERERGWEWTDPDEGDRHTLTGCTYPGRPGVIVGVEVPPRLTAVRP